LDFKILYQFACIYGETKNKGKQSVHPTDSEEQDKLKIRVLKTELFGVV
jgi:hypothetical protein